MSRHHVILAAVLVVVIAGAVVFFTLPSKHSPTATSAHAPGAPATIHAPSFTASYVEGWSLETRTNSRGAHRYQLSSTGAAINGLGIPPAGTVGITIDESAPAGLATAHIAGRPADSYRAVALLPFVVGEPASAVGVSRTERPTTTVLDGEEAGEEAFSYAYKGRQNLQVDVLSKHDGHLFLIELDAEPRLAHPSQSGLSAVTSGWRWR